MAFETANTWYFWKSNWGDHTGRYDEAHGFGRYLIPNNCGWMQKTRPYQDDNDMKHTTSENI